MKTFKIESNHDVYIDDFNEGEGDNVNSYQLNGEVKAKNKKEAVEIYFRENLYYSFDFKHAGYNEEDKTKIEYSNLVDEENSEASENEKKLWKEGNKTLYANNTTIRVFEFKECKF